LKKKKQLVETPDPSLGISNGKPLLVDGAIFFIVPRNEKAYAGIGSRSVLRNGEKEVLDL
jgi:hypothetical protein